MDTLPPPRVLASSLACRALVRVTLVALYTVWVAPATQGAVTVAGNVSPSLPAAGGTVGGPVIVGDSGVGTVTATLGSPISHSGGFTLGNTAAGIGLVSIDGLGSNWTLTTSGADMTVGNSGSGSLQITSLAQLSVNDDAFLGSQAGSTGSVTVTGLGTLWNNGDDMTIGDRGLGIVEVVAGGRLDSRDAELGKTATALGAGEGYATVSGEFSRWDVVGALTVGGAGRGELTIADGGRVSATANSTIASTVGSVGKTIITGTRALGSFSSSLTIGENGDAAVEVLDGARLEIGGALALATTVAARSSLSIAGPGSIVAAGGAFPISLGRVSLRVADDGLFALTSTPTFSADTTITLEGGIVRTSSASGMVNRGYISGTGRFESNTFANTTSGADRGTIRTHTGDVLSFSGALNNAGLVDMQGGELSTQGNVANNSDIDLRDAVWIAGGSGLDNNSGAQLAITSGIVDLYGRVDNNAGGQIIVGSDAYAVFHDDLVNSGQFVVMDGGSLLALENLTFAPSASLSLSLGADLEAAAIQVGGNAVLGGNLQISLADGANPSIGQSFPLVQAASSVTGSFDSATLPSLDNGLQWSLQQSSSAISLAVVQGLAADFDDDGDVDVHDLATWQAEFGLVTGATPSQGDADADHDVDGADFLVIQRELGSSLATGVATAPIPEPATLWLILALCGGGCVSRHRRWTGARVGC